MHGMQMTITTDLEIDALGGSNYIQGSWDDRWNVEGDVQIDSLQGEKCRFIVF